jgi:hypothetical protein
MAKDSFRIYIWMLDTIQRYGRITLAELKEKWRTCSANDSRKELAPRTFANYKENIEQIFGIEIACDRATNEYYIVNKSDFGDNSIRDWMLNSLSLRNLLNESAGLHERIVIEDVPSSHRFLTVIIDAMRDNRRMCISYKGYNMSDYQDMFIHPYCLRLFKRRWYIVAYSEYSKENRLFMLDRARSVEVLTDSFTMPEDFDAEEYFNDIYGVRQTDRSEMMKVVLKVNANRCDLLRNLPLHPSQKEIETTPEYSIFKVELKPNFDLKQELISYLDALEVLEPVSLRDELRMTIKSMYRKYIEPN